MKRISALLLAGALLLSLAACGKEEPVPTTEAPTTVPTTAPTTVPTTAPTTVPTTAPTTVPTTEATTVATEPEYVLPQGFEEVDETVYATRSVNIRTEPTVNSYSPAKLMRGDSIRRVGVSPKGWSAVMYREELCFIATQYLTQDAPQEYPQGGSGGKVTESASSGTVYTNHYVNLRKGPGADTAFMLQIPEGAVLTRLAVCSNGWVKVNYNGSIGYVAGGYLSNEPPVPETSTPPETKPAETTKPGKDPSETTKPGKDPSETTKPSKDPSETSKPSTDPSESQKPSTDPSETQKPKPSTDPSETQKPKPSTDPSESQKPSTDPSKPEKPSTDPSVKE